MIIIIIIIILTLIINDDDDDDDDDADDDDDSTLDAGTSKYKYCPDQTFEWQHFFMVINICCKGVNKHNADVINIKEQTSANQAAERGLNYLHKDLLV